MRNGSKGGAWSVGPRRVLGHFVEGSAGRVDGIVEFGVVDVNFPRIDSHDRSCLSHEKLKGGDVYLDELAYHISREAL